MEYKKSDIAQCVDNKESNCRLINLRDGLRNEVKNLRSRALDVNNKLNAIHYLGELKLDDYPCKEPESLLDEISIVLNDLIYVNQIMNANVNHINEIA